MIKKRWSSAPHDPHNGPPRVASRYFFAPRYLRRPACHTPSEVYIARPRMCAQPSDVRFFR